VLSKKINVLVVILVVLSVQLVAMELIVSRQFTTAHDFLKDSVKSLDEMNTIKDEFYAAVDKEKLESELDLPHLKNRLQLLFNEYEQKCPLFMIDECTDEADDGQNGFPCLFSRNCNDYRNSFEERISQKLVEKINQATGSVTYTTFGCGGAFLELNAITKALMQCPRAHVNMHCIEGYNQSYIGAAGYLKITQEITLGQKMFDFGDTFDSYAEQIKKQEKLPDSVDEIKSQVVYTSYLVQKKYQQMLAWLTKTFSEAKLSLFIHNIVNNYLTYLEIHNLPHADVVSAADIQDWVSMQNKAVSSYVLLCIKTLEKKPDSCNVWLAKDPRNVVAINTVSPSAHSTSRLNLTTAHITVEPL
jgi:hypothetical protein